MAHIVRKYRIRYLFFESLHLWNAALMALCPQCVKIEAIHDVIPHDGNRSMALSNLVTSRMADHVLLRNHMYREELSRRYGIPSEKITSFRLWRYFPEEVPVRHTKRFLCFGRIRRYKGADQLTAIAEQTPEVFYRLVGMPDGETRELVEQLKKRGNVEVVDREVTDQEMSEEFLNADWVILPYNEATQSGVIVDACKFARSRLMWARFPNRLRTASPDF